MSNNNRRRRRSGAQTSGNPQRRNQASGPDYDRIAELEEQLARARAAEDIEFDERFDAEIDEPDDEPQRPARRGRSDQDKPKFVHHNGQRYRLPDSADDWDVDALEAFETGKVVSAVKGVLGEAAWRQIRASHDGKLRVKDLEPLANQIAKAYGFDTSGE